MSFINLKIFLLTFPFRLNIPFVVLIKIQLNVNVFNLRLTCVIVLLATSVPSARLLKCAGLVVTKRRQSIRLSSEVVPCCVR